MDLKLCVIHAFGINPASNWQKRLLTIKNAYSFDSKKVGRFLIDFANPTDDKELDLGEVTITRAIYQD